MTNLPEFFNKYSILKNIPIFQKLNWLELQKISRKASLVEFKKGQYVYREGSESDAFYCLISGRLQAYTLNKNGMKENVEYIQRGMHFGIISLLTGETHSLTFEVLNDSIVLKIDKDDFSEILKKIPHLGVELSRSLSRRMHHQVRKKSIFESTLISIYSPTPGTGASTFAVNLALNLARETKRKVILVNITSSRQIETIVKTDIREATPQWKKRGVALSEIVDDHEKIIDAVAKGAFDFDTLNVVIDPSDTSVMDQISFFVSALVNDYHYVVVDLPNHMDKVVAKTLVQSDLVQLLTNDYDNDLALTQRVVAHLQKVHKNNFHPGKVQVIMTGVEDKCYLSYEEINQKINYQVTTMLPHLSHRELAVALQSDNMTVITPDPDSAYAKIVRRIARRIGGVSIGLVLGGGAALGLAHIGVLRVLEKENIPVDIVAGSSMGALIASMWVTGRTADQVEDAAYEFERRIDLLKLIDPVFPKAALIGGRAIKRWLARHLDNKTFAGTDIPLKIVAYDLIKRQEIVVEEGRLVDAVRKSIGIPGVINPVLENGQMIIDGGILNPLPVNVLASLGIRKIIAVNVLQSPKQVAKSYEKKLRVIKEDEKILFLRSPVKFLGVRWNKLMHRLFWPNISDMVVQSFQASEYVMAEKSAHQADVLIHPDVSGFQWFELYQVETLIKRGEDAAKARLQDIKELIQT